jgi:hypothetical protein
MAPITTLNTTWGITAIETGTFTSEWSPSINPAKPDSFTIEPGAQGELIIVCSSLPTNPFAGALAKTSLPWLAGMQTPNVSASYQFKFDDSVNYGQVVETDWKFTDANGWTYDGSFQWNIASGWIAQFGSPWVNAGFTGKFTQGLWNQVSVQYKIDYANHTIQIVAINGTPVTCAPVPAKQIGWGKNEAVGQFQLCTASKGGAYEVQFTGIAVMGNS